MFMNTVAKLEVLIEHGPQRERDRLYGLVAPSLGFLEEGGLTLSIIYDVGGVSSGSLECEETEGVSRSSKQMPPRAG